MSVAWNMELVAIIVIAVAYLWISKYSWKSLTIKAASMSGSTNSSNLNASCETVFFVY